MVEETQIKDLKGLLDFCEYLLNKTKNGNCKWIFRGEKYNNDINNTLKTTLEKSFDNFGVQNSKAKLNVEKDIIRSFQRKLHLYASNLPSRADIIQWLSIMQHHGAPTRLLDWTYSFWVAVHFAIIERKPNEKAALWAINTRPIWLYQEENSNNKFGKHKEFYDQFLERGDLVYCDDDAISDNALIHSLFKIKFPDEGCKPAVFASSAFRRNQRVTIQQGTFLIPVDIAKSFQENLFPYIPEDENHAQVGVISLDKEEKQEVCEHLRQMNINNAVLFPGLDGFSQSLWTRSGLPLKDILSLPSKKLDLYP